MAICHAEASRIGVRSHSGLRLEWARYPTAKWLACAGASMRFGSLIWNNQTALAKAATEHPAQTRRARPGLFRGSQAALRRRSAGIKRASPAFLPGRCSEGVPGSVAVNLRDRVEICRRAAWGRRSKRPGRKVGHKKGPGRGRNPGPQVWIRFGDVTESGVGPLREEKRTRTLRRVIIRTRLNSKSFRRSKIFCSPAYPVVNPLIFSESESAQLQGRACRECFAFPRGLTPQMIEIV